MKAFWIYTKDQSKRKAVDKAAAAIKAQVKELNPADLNKPVGAIIGMPVFGKSEKAQIPPFFMLPEMLLISGVSSDELDVFLDVYKKQNVPAIPYKAMATPFNVSWTLYELAQELRKEHSAYQNR